MKKIHYLFALLLISGAAMTQYNTDGQYAKPLRAVLTDVQKRFDITIKLVDSLVEGRVVKYAEWRYRNDAETTLDNILRPFDLKVKKEKDKVYKLSAYEYYRWSVEDGWAELDRIASQYKNLDEWEGRKQAILPCLWEALQLKKLPASPGSAPIITARRVYNGYSVENIALEILPGLWINGSLYRPEKKKGKLPVILNPDGHWEKQRYRPDCQLRSAALARMGALTFSYDLFAWGESLLQFKLEDHRRSLSMTIQALGSIRILDYLLSLKEADSNRVAMTGGSGAGSHTVLLTALDERIKVSAPVVSLSSYFYGGCPCESGMPIHDCGARTDNVELAAMAAPRPMLVVSDGKDWTDRMPEHDFLYLQKIYGWYGTQRSVENVHLKEEGHDFGINKRKAVYDFMARTLALDSKKILNEEGQVDETTLTVEDEKLLYVFGEKGELLPAHAIRGFAQLEQVFHQLTK